MIKENIIITYKTEIGITEKILIKHDRENLEKNHPEMEFVLITEKSLEGRPIDEAYDGPLFVIGEERSMTKIIWISEDDLRDPVIFWDWKRRIMAHTWLKNQKITTRRNLYEIWYKLKFLCQEILNTEARRLGREMADLVEDVNAEILQTYKNAILTILTLPSSPKRIRNSLWKNYANQLKRTKSPLAHIKNPEDTTGDETLLLELKSLEEEALRTGTFFGTSPIIYRKNME